MPETEAGSNRKSEDIKPRKEKIEPAAAKKIKQESRRSSSTSDSGMIELFPICYKGAVLSMPVQPHFAQVAFRILKQVYYPLVPHVMLGLPKKWYDSNPDVEQVISYVQNYNKTAKPFAKAWAGSYNEQNLKEWAPRRCNLKVATEITTFAYECAVPRPADLNNHYKSFSSETYGETNLEQMASIIDELQLGENDVLVDLGSGIGQLVCFTAAYANIKKVVGIELSNKPAKHAAQMGKHFHDLMKHFGKEYSKYELIQGDFLDPKFKPLICDEATVVFINNFAFDPDLMQQIKVQLLQELKQGIRIVTSKPFGPNRREANYRMTNDITCISDSVEMRSLESGVSWTANKVTFWLTTMDHLKLMRYYEEAKSKKGAKQSRENSEARDREQHKKRKTEHHHREHRENGEKVRDKIKTEQAAASSSSTSAQHAHQSPKWNEPDTDYTPPVKKPKKHRESVVDTSSTPKESKKKREKEREREREKEREKSVVKTVKPPKSSSHHHHSSRHYESSSSSSSHRTSTSTTPMTVHASHPPPSQPKATAPPPPPPPPSSQPQRPPSAKVHHHHIKVEEPAAVETEHIHGRLLDAKTMSALHTIREAASTSTQAAAIQDAIDSVLSQPEEPSLLAPCQPQVFAAAPPLPAPVAVYPSAPLMAPPNPPPPQQAPPPPNVIPPSSELAAEQRHTFMIPPTDPLYDMIVGFYFGFKAICNQSKSGDLELINKLRQDIENEKARRNELNESMASTNEQIQELLATGVTVLKSRLDELGMTSVNDVGELLAGSKHIVTQHKALTTNVAQLESSVAVEEHKLRMMGGPDAVKVFDEANLSGNFDVTKLSELIIASRPSNFVAQIVPDEPHTTDSKVSPSSRRPRPKPRQTASTGTAGGGGGNKRGTSAGRKSDGASEDVEFEIQQFVQRALKVDNAVKEKERKARGNFLAAAERMPQKVSGTAAPSATTHHNHHHGLQLQQQHSPSPHQVTH